MKYMYCEKCDNVVSESEVGDPFKLGHTIHTYIDTRNAYGRQSPGVIGYCPVDEPVYCGKVREPTELEYFIYVTLGEHKKKPRRKR